MKDLIRRILKEEVETKEKNGDDEKTKITHKNFFKNFLGKFKKSKKFNNWVKKTFGGKVPNEEEVFDYIRGPKKTPEKLSPTEPEKPTISESIKFKRNKMYLFESESLAAAYRIWANSTDELSKKYGKKSKYKLDVKSDTPDNNYFLNSYKEGKADYEKYLANIKSTDHQKIVDTYNNNRKPIINDLNNIIKTKVIPSINKELNSSINKWYGSCYDLWLDTVCFGANVDVNIPYIRISDIVASKSWVGDYTVIKYAAYTKVKIYIGIQAVGFNVWEPTMTVYPNVSGEIIINNDKKSLSINPPKLDVWTDWLDLGVVYAYINANKLKMHNRYVGPYEWALPIQQKINEAFETKTFSLEKDAPFIYNLLP